jgi:cytochrome c oxidase subunit I+III
MTATANASLLGPDAVRARLERAWARPGGLRGILGTTDHKAISLRFLVTALAFFALDGALTVTLRLQDALPLPRLVDTAAFAHVVPLHPVVMAVLFALPALHGIAGYAVPLAAGTRNVALPRLFALCWWMHLAAGLALFGSLAAGAGGPGVVATAIVLGAAAALGSSLALAVTILKLRAPGMALARMPVMLWAQLAGAGGVIVLAPAIVLGGLLLIADATTAGAPLLQAPAGGDVLLAQRLLTSHDPAVLLLLALPAVGFAAAIVETFSRRVLFGRRAVSAALVTAAALALAAWALRQSGYAGPAGTVTLLLAAPAAVVLTCLVVTLWSGRLTVRAPLLFALGAIVMAAAALTASLPFATEVTSAIVSGTAAETARLYLVTGALVLALFAAAHYWFPKWTGRLLDEPLARWQLGLLAAGHVLGWLAWQSQWAVPSGGAAPARLTTIAVTTALGGALIAAGFIMFIVNVRRSLVNGRPAGANPWAAGTLEWATDSPPPPYNFASLPIVRDAAPLWHSEVAAYDGLDAEERLALVTSIAAAVPQHDHRFPADDDSLFVLARSAVVWWAMLGVLAAATVAAALLAGIYLDVRAETYPFPPPSVRSDAVVLDTRPSLAIAALGLAALLATAILMQRARRGSLEPHRAAPALLAAAAAVLVLRVLEFDAVHVRWYEHAYGSAVWAILALHSIMLACAVAGLAIRRAAAGPALALLWWWTAALWLPLAGLVFMVPHLS